MPRLHPSPQPKGRAMHISYKMFAGDSINIVLFTSSFNSNKVVCIRDTCTKTVNIRMSNTKYSAC